MQTTDPSLLFQTSQQLADAAYKDKKIAAAQNVGNPIKLSSKVLDLAIVGDLGWTAESGWQARCVDLKTGKTRRLFKGHKGPVTSVCLHEVTSPSEEGKASWLALFTASWDKTVRIWDADSGDLVAEIQGHTDFVKSVSVVQSSPPLLLSTSSDKSVRVWDLAPLRQRKAPTCRQILKEHTRPVETAVSRISDDSENVEVWTADSMGVIKKWRLPRFLSSDNNSPMVFDKNVLGHETSVVELALSDDQLWSASMDNTAKNHNVPKTTLLHPSYVKTVLPFPCGMPYILTGSEDEDIRVWDASHLELNNRTPLSTVVGHCGEVTSLAPWVRNVDGKKELVIVSASLDSTLRRWSMEELLQPPSLDLPPRLSEVTMTEEEERELAELLSESE